MRKIILMSGIPGSGKSFEAQLRINLHIRDTFPQDQTIISDPVSRPVISGNGWTTGASIILLSTDHYFMQKGDYKFDVSKLGDAHGLCLKSYIRGVQDTLNQLLIVDNTMTSIEELAPYIAIAQAHKVPVEVITVVVPAYSIQLAAERNSHGVPTNTISRMHTNLAHRGDHIPFHWQPSMGVLFTEVPAVFP